MRGGARTCAGPGPLLLVCALAALLGAPASSLAQPVEVEEHGHHGQVQPPSAEEHDHEGATRPAEERAADADGEEPSLEPPPLPVRPAPASPEPAERADPAPGSAAEEDPRELLRQAIDLYVVGRYRQAAERLRPLVETRVLEDRADQQEALRAFGISLFLSGARAGAERAFRGLLRLDPKARLDPQFVRPEVVEFYEGVRRRYLAEFNAELRKRGPRGPAVANLLPPWGQFQNGHRTKGWLILGGELALGAASITTAALLYSWRDSTGQFPGHEDHYTGLSTANYVTFGALAALLVYAVVDGLYYYYRAPRPTDLPAGAPPPPQQAAAAPLFRF